MRRRAYLTLIIGLALAGCMQKRAPVVAIAPPPVAAAPADVQVTGEIPYRLAAGDRLRVVVFGQEGLSNSYTVDPNGAITLPLIGSVQARNQSTAELSRTIAARLKQGYIREPHVAVEIEAYRPFFILGEVTYPGQYPYVANMSVETAVAIAGGFTPRAEKGGARITRSVDGVMTRGNVPLAHTVRPGDTINIGERWF